MDAWLKRAREKHPQPEPSIDECINAPRRAAAFSVERAIENNSRIMNGKVA